MFRTRPSRAPKAPRCWTSSRRCARTGPTSNAPSLRPAIGRELGPLLQLSREVRRVDAEAQESLLPAARALDADPRRGKDPPPGLAVVDHIQIRRLQPGAVQHTVDVQRARDQSWTAAPSDARPRL